jgi:hypothetical protein
VHLDHFPVAVVAALTNIFFVMVMMIVATDQMKSLVKFQNVTHPQDFVCLRNSLAGFLQIQLSVFL